MGWAGRGGVGEELVACWGGGEAGRGGKSWFEKWGGGGVDGGEVLYDDVDVEELAGDEGDVQLGGDVQPRCSRIIANGRGSGG
jgi:hypothetical protein